MYSEMNTATKATGYPAFSRPTRRAKVTYEGEIRSQWPAILTCLGNQKRTHAPSSHHT